MTDEPKPTFSSSRPDFAMEACDPDLPPPESGPIDEQEKMTKFTKEVGHLINKYSLESASDTPDFILACYLSGCLAVFNAATKARESWYGRIISGPPTEPPAESRPLGSNKPVAPVAPNVLPAGQSD